MCKCKCCCDCDCCYNCNNEVSSVKELIEKIFSNNKKTYVLKNTCGEVEGYDCGEKIIRDKSNKIEINKCDLSYHFIKAVGKHNGWTYYYLT